jgi:CRISPR system Cascade subunit CasD
MPSFLLFTLAAPMASFGGVAVGERRDSWERPSVSALLGLLAAALGVDRSDDATHTALALSYRFAVRVEQPGDPFADYHTAQVAPQRKGRRFATRASELAVDDLETILSRREYRSDVLSTVAVAAAETPPYTLEVLSNALSRPSFTLYLGRKSCPLALPLTPRIVQAENIVTAFSTRDVEETASIRQFRQESGYASTPRYISIDRRILPPDLHVSRIERRRDQPESRARRLFTLREEAILHLDARGGMS